jgi:hypothetical protein
MKTSLGSVTKASTARGSVVASLKNRRRFQFSRLIALQTLCFGSFFFPWAWGSGGLGQELDNFPIFPNGHRNPHESVLLGGFFHGPLHDFGDFLDALVGGFHGRLRCGKIFRNVPGFSIWTPTVIFEKTGVGGQVDASKRKNSSVIAK